MNSAHASDGAAVCAEHQPQQDGMSSDVKISVTRLNSQVAATGLGDTVVLQYGINGPGRENRG